jgi:hypothetical protein
MIPQGLVYQNDTIMIRCGMTSLHNIRSDGVAAQDAIDAGGAKLTPLLSNFSRIARIIHW